MGGHSYGGDYLMEEESETTEEQCSRLPRKKYKWYESTNKLLFIIAAISFLMIWVIFVLMIKIPSTFDNPLSPLLITIFSLGCSAIFSFLASTISYERRIEEYALGAMNHLDAIFSNTNEIHNQIQNEIDLLEKLEGELNKRSTTSMLENIAVMISGLSLQIQVAETKWLSICGHEFEQRLPAHTQRHREWQRHAQVIQELIQEKLNNLANQKVVDSKKIDELEEIQEILSYEPTDDTIKSAKRTT